MLCRISQVTFTHSHTTPDCSTRTYEIHQYKTRRDCENCKLYALAVIAVYAFSLRYSLSLSCFRVVPCSSFVCLALDAPLHSLCSSGGWVVKRTVVVCLCFSLDLNFVYTSDESEIEESNLCISSILHRNFIYLNKIASKSDKRILYTVFTNKDDTVHIHFKSSKL